MTSRGPFQPELFPDSTNPLSPGDWPLSPVLYFLFLRQPLTQNPTYLPILWQLSSFTKCNKLSKSFSKAFWKCKRIIMPTLPPLSAHLQPFLQMPAVLDFTGASPTPSQQSVFIRVSWRAESNSTTPRVIKQVCLLRRRVRGGSLLLTCTPSHKECTYLLQSLSK